MLYPWAALLPAALFIALWLYRARRGSSATQLILGALPVLAWLAYAVYEWRMKIWSASVIAPIRIDLLAIVPALVVISVAGLVMLAQRRAA